MKSRIQSSFRNIYSGILLQVLNILLNIITRRFFVITFGIEILGLNGVMINIISKRASAPIFSEIIITLYPVMASSVYLI